MTFQLCKKVKLFLRNCDSQRKRIFVSGIALVRKNFELGFEFHLEFVVIVEAGNQTKRDFSGGSFHWGAEVAVGD